MRILRRLAKTLLVAAGIILFWRGAWGLMDLYIHPTEPLVSYIISLILGLGLLAYTHHLYDSLK